MPRSRLLSVPARPPHHLPALCPFSIEGHGVTVSAGEWPKKHPTSRSTKVMKGGHYLAEGEGELLAAEKNLNLP